ncbi:hypothetical protein H4217_000003 [Coemansia sp. RSA 1939]|nr:hypothetical protein H4217_000003 [Coemansia sp. RSA 1939]KAJ2618298.1 hypothetical protein EV177_000017 [Coemansia sp. RSA 1804]KAJ2694416.1 hypothetical protein GGH99_000687 [Coemansia sp. RSA 1285]
MTATQTLVHEIRQLLECELGESALALAELECKPLLSDQRVSASERLQLLRIYSDCLDKQKQHRTSLRVITEFISGPERSQLTSEELEEVARDIAQQRWQLGEHDLCLAQLRQIPRTHRSNRDVARMARCAALVRAPDARELHVELLRRQPNASEALAFVVASSSAASAVGAAKEERARMAAAAASADGASYHDAVSLASALGLMQALDYRGANEELARLGRRHPRNALVRAHQATCRFMLDDVRAARALYERARMLDPTLVDQMGTYAALLASGSGADDMHAVYRLGNALLKTDQTRAEGWVAMARYFLLAGDTQEALAIAWRAQTLAPSLSDAYYTEGVIQMASGGTEDAVEVFAKAHQLGRSAHTFRALVDALVQCGRYKEAFVHAREMAEALPQHAGALATVGIVLSHSAESSDKARRLLEAAIALDCRCAEAVGALASLHVASGQTEDALRVLESHLPDIQTDDMYTRYADVLTLAGELPKAAANYATALAINPSNERARAGVDRVDALLHPGGSGAEEPDELEEHEEPEELHEPDASEAPMDTGAVYY